MLVPPRAPEGGAERQVSPSRHWPRRSPALTQPARRAVAPGGSRPPGARHGPRGRGRALRVGRPRPCSRCHPGVTTSPTGRRAKSAGMPRRGPGQSLQRPWRAGRAAVRVRITLDGAVAIYDGAQCVAQHVLQPAAQGWVTVPDHHAALWADTLAVERRPLAVYAEVTTWN